MTFGHRWSARLWSELRDNMRIFSFFGPNRKVLDGMSCKMYKIERTGRRVTAYWGPAVWDRKLRRPKPATKTCLQQAVWPFHSDAQAEHFLRRNIATKLAKGYKQNPRRRSD